MTTRNNSHFIPCRSIWTRLFATPDKTGRHSQLGWLLVLWIVLVATLGTSSGFAAEALVIQNVSTIDAVHGLQRTMTVVVRGNRILTIGKASEVQLPNGATVIDGTGKYLIPGLWDAHVHLSFERDVTPSMFTLFTVNGVTSIRDTGGLLRAVLPWRERARKDPKNAPRVMVAGPLLDGIPVVYDGSSSKRPELGVGASSVAEAARLVDEMAAAGVDFIKSYEMLSPVAFTAIIRRAKAKGLHVTGHVPLSMDVITASNAGLRSMEHLRNFEMSCSSHSEQLLDARRLLLKQGANDLGGILRSRIHQAQRMHAVKTQDKGKRNKVLKALVENGTWQIPTLTIVTDHRLYASPAWRETFKYLPNSVTQRWIVNAIHRSEDPIDPARTAYSTWAYEMVGHMSKAGVGIMAGTDCPILFLTPGFSLHEELRMLVQGGLTPMQALEAATLKPAEYFGMDKELGTIADGMLADLVLLNGNPLEDITNTRRINAVVRDGKLHNRASLDEMMRELEAQ